MRVKLILLQSVGAEESKGPMTRREHGSKVQNWKQELQDSAAEDKDLLKAAVQ